MTDTGLSSRAHAVIGFVVAGAALVALAEVMPEAALGLAGVLALGVVLTHPQELAAMSEAFQSAVAGRAGGEPTAKR